MFIHVGNNRNIRTDRIIGIFDADTATVGKDTKKFLFDRQKEGTLKSVCDELPKSFVLCDKNDVFFTQLSVKTLIERNEKDGF